jgi:hypothetical protein
MGIIADQFRAHLERLEEIDQRQNELIEKLLRDTKKFVEESEQLTRDYE